MVRTQEPGEAVFQAFLPEEVEWKPSPAFPPSARLAVLIGDPTRPGPYVIRVKAPSGVKLMPHGRAKDRIYTVTSGDFYIGFGEKFDGAASSCCRATRGAFTGAKSAEYVSQVNAIGPVRLEYHRGDDPRG